MRIRVLLLYKKKARSLVHSRKKGDIMFGKGSWSRALDFFSLRKLSDLTEESDSPFALLEGRRREIPEPHDPDSSNDEAV